MELPMVSPEREAEYTERLMRIYEQVKASNGGVMSIRALLDALQKEKLLLEVLEECTDFSTQTRHELYRELFVALQREERDRHDWKIKQARSKDNINQALSESSKLVKDAIADDPEVDKASASLHSSIFNPNLTFEQVKEMLPPCTGGVAHDLAGTTLAQPFAKDIDEASQVDEFGNKYNDKEMARTLTNTPDHVPITPPSREEALRIAANKRRRTPPETSLSKRVLSGVRNYQSASVERRLALSRTTNILNLDGCGLKRFPDLLPQALKELKEVSVKANDIKNLPAEVGYAVKVERMNVARNLLSRLPESVVRLPYLLCLDVSDNRLEYLPSAIGDLTHLRVLAAGNNRLESLPTGLGRLIQLERLDLDENPRLPAVLRDKLNHSIPSLLAFLQSLAAALLQAKEIIKSAAADIVSEVEESAKADNSSANPEEEDEAKEKHNITNLNAFDPRNNEFLPGIDINTIGERDVYLSAKLMTMAEFGMVGRIVDVRRAVFRSRSELVSRTRGVPLVLDHLGLASVTDDVIPSDPQVLAEIKALSLDRNSLLSRLDSFRQVLPRFQGLRRLSLKSCSIKFVPSSTDSGMNALVALQSLDLAQNQITEIHKHAFYGLNNLQFLDVSENQLNSLPGTGLCELVSLKSLVFHCNGPGLEENAKLQDAIHSGKGLPAIFGALIAQEKGYVTGSMTRQIRSEMMENRLSVARQIGVLDLSLVLEEGLEPEIPVDIMPRTKDLDLRGNGLYRFPRCVALMFRLTRINAANNRLENRAFYKDRINYPGPSSPSGVVPSAPVFDSMDKLLVMDLSRNNLGPELPPSLMKIAPRLQVLMLDHNQLERISPVFADSKTSKWPETLKSIALRGNPLPTKLLQAAKDCGVPGLFAALVALKEQEDVEARRLHRAKMEAAEKAEHEKHLMLQRHRNRQQKAGVNGNLGKEGISAIAQKDSPVGSLDEAAADKEAEAIVKAAEEQAERGEKREDTSHLK